MRFWVAPLLVTLAAPAVAGLFARDVDPDAPAWTEEEVALPALPRDEDLMPFFVSATARHKFYVDGASLAVGRDGVVRYALVIKTEGGATNISFEGMRCASREYRLYAVARADGSWAPARNENWRPVESKSVNRHHAELSRDFLCPVGDPITSAEDGRAAFRRGKHPSVP